MFTLLTTTLMQLTRFFGATTPCDPTVGAGSFLGLPHWYEFLPGQTDEISGKCIPVIHSINDFWAIALAIVEILLRIGGMVAVVYVIYGGFLYMTSQGEADRTSAAKSTILNALVGVVIVIIAIVAVNFVGATIK
jgi:hypothetical protein